MNRKLATLAALTLAACGGPYTLTAGEAKNAELGARQFAERNGGTFVSCSPQDSDGDSYVTCSTKDKAGTDVAVLCAYKSDATGCKLK